MERKAQGALSDLTEALAALPLFPLPQTVLFPGVLMPFHIFEPRYRALVRDVLETHRSLGIVLITRPDVVDAFGHPTIASIASVGTIVDHAELPGGRYNILVRGRARVRLDELPFVPPYRRAAATVLSISSNEPSQQDLVALMTSATRFASFVKERERSFDFRLPEGASPTVVADLCASQLVLDEKERQTILETLDPAQRVRRVAEALAMQTLTLGPPSRELN